MCLALPFTNINSLNAHAYAEALPLLLPHVMGEENEEQRGLVIFRGHTSHQQHSRIRTQVISLQGLALNRLIG